jgi:hypothetical protein
MIEILEKIFGSAAKVKIMRLFLFNPEASFDTGQIAERAKVTSSVTRHEVHNLVKIGLIKKRSFFKEVVIRRGSKKKVYHRRASGWTLNEYFEYLVPLRNLLEHVSVKRNRSIVRKLSRIGTLKLVIMSGFFIHNTDSRVDLLIVADNIRKVTLENIIKTIESELGREITYSAFETEDFKYRLGIYDKLVRDILDYQHEKILDKIGLEDTPPAL